MSRTWMALAWVVAISGCDWKPEVGTWTVELNETGVADADAMASAVGLPASRPERAAAMKALLEQSIQSAVDTYRTTKLELSWNGTYELVWTHGGAEMKETGTWVDAGGKTAELTCKSLNGKSEGLPAPKTLTLDPDDRDRASLSRPESALTRTTGMQAPTIALVRSRQGC